MKTKYHPNGAIKSIKYRQNNIQHRDDGPAYQEWNDAGVLIEESWCQHGSLHRDNGPAIQEWNGDHILTWESWWQHGRWHRDNGPAVRQWNDAGVLVVELWHQNDRNLTAAEIEKLMRPADIMAAIWTLPQPIAEEIAKVFRVC